MFGIGISAKTDAKPSLLEWIAPIMQATQKITEITLAETIKDFPLTLPSLLAGSPSDFDSAG